MRNIIKSELDKLQENPTYASIPTGAMFRFVEPWNLENIYMKTNNPDYCIQLNTGTLYVMSVDKRVVPLYKEGVSIKNEY